MAQARVECSLLRLMQLKLRLKGFIRPLQSLGSLVSGLFEIKTHSLQRTIHSYMEICSELRKRYLLRLRYSTVRFLELSLVGVLRFKPWLARLARMRIALSASQRT